MAKLTDDEITTRNSYNKTAKNWSSNHWTENFWRENLGIFHKFLPSGKLLEIGCGAGRDAQDLINLGYDYLGTDISVGLLAEARKNNPDGVFKKVSLYNLDFKEPFDGFWCAAVLIHVPKDRISEALLSINRNMKTGATGFITVKEGEGERLEQREELGNAKFLFAHWQNIEFKNTLEKNGYKVLNEGYMPMSKRTKWLTYHVQVV